MHNAVVKSVEWFLKGAAALVICVAAGIVDAEASDHDHEPFPWRASGWHQYQRSQAYNIAYNKAVIQCNNWNMVLDTQSLSVEYGWVSIDPGYHSANLIYYCDVPPPRYAKRTIQPVNGTYECDPRHALQQAEDAASAACRAIDRNRNWFLGESTIVGVSRTPTGSCGGVNDGWNVPEKTRYRLLPECWLQY